MEIVVTNVYMMSAFVLFSWRASVALHGWRAIRMLYQRRTTTVHVRVLNQTRAIAEPYHVRVGALL